MATVNLGNACIDLKSLKENNVKDLTKILEINPSSTQKAMIIDPTVSGPIGTVLTVKQFRQLGVQQFALLNSSSLSTGGCDGVFYFVRPNPSMISLLIQQLKARQKDPKQRSVPVYVYFVSRRSLVCERMLNEAGVISLVTLGEYNLDIIPVEQDVLSMELPNVFYEMNIDSSSPSLVNCANALGKIQNAFGTIPLIKGKGVAAQKIVQLLYKASVSAQGLRDISIPNASTSTNTSTTASTTNMNNLRIPEISQCIIIDRAVDLISPILLQNTYEGLIDEYIGIQNNIIEISASESTDLEKQEKDGDNTSTDPKNADKTDKGEKGKMKKILLNSSDRLFDTIRDVPFTAIGPILHRRTEYIKNTYSERHNAQSIQDMHKYLAKFKTVHQEHSLLTVHMGIADKIAKEIHSTNTARRLQLETDMLLEVNQNTSEMAVSNAVYRHEPITTVIRLLILLAWTVGLSKNYYHQFKLEFIQQYGFVHLKTLFNLEKMGVLNRLVPRIDWRSLSSKLRLTLNEQQTETMLKTINTTAKNVGTGTNSDASANSGGITSVQDYHYVYKRYAPLTVRLIETAVQPNGWNIIDKEIATLPGPHFEYRQELPVEVQERMYAPHGYEQALPIPYCQPDPSAKALRAVIPTKLLKFMTQKKTSEAGSIVEHKKPIILIFFVGGCTYSEISALRHLSQSSSHDRTYLVLTTKIINGETFVSSIIDPLDNHLDVPS